MIDLSPLFPAPKLLPPIDEQLSNESRKFWYHVTDAIVNKQYSQATTLKQEIEERQREKAADRKTRGADWQPRFFTSAIAESGQPDLTKDGEEAIQGLLQNNFKLEPNKELGA